MQNDYQHWKLDQDQDNILWLTFDKANSSTNTLDLNVFNELEQILAYINQTPAITAVVIRSGKTNGFIAGADIEQFTQLKDASEAYDLIHRGQEIFAKLEELSVPSVALIDGFCMGGGVELALACTYRVAEDGRTRLALPEVMLGFYPGWGGIVRLPKLVGALKAMDMILSGRGVSAKAAKRMGLVDAAVARRYLDVAARHYALKKPAKRQATWFEQLTNQAWVRPLLARVFRKKLRAKIRPDFYPGPFAAVDYWEKYGVAHVVDPKEAVDMLANLQQNDSAKNLVRVFFLQDRLKNLGKATVFEAKHVHVIGAGTMGGDIAAWCAYKGFQVTLQDRDPQIIAKALSRAHVLFKKKLKDRLKVQAAMDRLTADIDGRGVPHADVIIEAIFENLEAKQNLFKDLEGRAKATAVLATNTSSIPLDEINQVLAKPERLVGIHFFNPVAKMMLVEVVQGSKTSQSVVEQALAFVRKIDKLPLPVKSSPGFLVNRVLMPYLMECMALMQDGYSKENIDKAAVDFGMPMGPVQLADTVGLDVCLSVAKNLTAHFGGEVPAQLVSMVNEKKLGVKTGEGFYRYAKGKPVKAETKAVDAHTAELIQQRLIFRLLNESAACLREGVVADQDLLDAGMIFGTGFAPFRGGPIHYAQSLGAEKVLAVFTQLAAQFGARFNSDQQWPEILK